MATEESAVVDSDGIFHGHLYGKNVANKATVTFLRYDNFGKKRKVSAYERNDCHSKKALISSLLPISRPPILRFHYFIYLKLKNKFKKPNTKNFGKKILMILSQLCYMRLFKFMLTLQARRLVLELRGLVCYSDRMSSK